MARKTKRTGAPPAVSTDASPKADAKAAQQPAATNAGDRRYISGTFGPSYSSGPVGPEYDAWYQDRWKLLRAVLNAEPTAVPTHSPPKSDAAPMSDEPTALDNYDLKILKALDDRWPLAMFQADIEQAAGMPRRTIGKRLSALRKQGFVCRPRGKRGETITDRGREVYQAAMKRRAK